jgi:hypothetical protein
MKLNRLLPLLPFLRVLPLQPHPGHSLVEHGAAYAIKSPYHLAILDSIATVVFAALISGSRF